MAQDSNALVWLDMEMTGLNPDADRIIEMAVVITNGQLETVAESAVWVVHQDRAVLDGMDDWNKKTHGRSGLIDKVRSSALHEAEVEAQCLEFLRRHVPAGKSPMCGNSICQDRRFMARWMPRLETYFHYRNLDVSTLKDCASDGSPRSPKASRRNRVTRPWPISTNRSMSSSTTASTS